MCPDLQECILDRVFGFGLARQHAARNGQHLGQMPRHQRLRRSAVALPSPSYEVGIRIDHLNRFPTMPKGRAQSARKGLSEL